MKIQRYLPYLIVAVIATALMSAGAIAEDKPASTSGAASGTGTTPAPFISFKNYPDQAFNVREYINGMQKGGHNLLIWKDPSANLSQYSSVKATEFGGRLLPQQNVFSYDPYIALFNSVFKSSFKPPQTGAPNALLVAGAVVECNPGSRAARAWVGMGAGRAGGAVVCEVYEPGKSQPCIRIYTRDTGSSGSWGGDSSAMLNNIMSQLATRLAATLNTTLAIK
ncbi:MAG: DUF4410 domain-containing protein [Desulfobacterales bacterium]|nr:DUF4410 domain-containing protein [Desulfobacterales bacterium]